MAKKNPALACGTSTAAGTLQSLKEDKILTDIMDDVIAAKAASTRRCIKRAGKKFQSAGDHSKTYFMPRGAAIHAYQRIDIEIVIRVIQHRLDDVLMPVDRMIALNA